MSAAAGHSTVAKPTFAIRASAFASSRVLQRRCACGGTADPMGDCDACREKKREVQRSRGNSSAPAHSGSSLSEVARTVRDVLHSSGQPLDGKTRAFMEPRFGHDFNRVRIHTDDQAADSARAVNALAYTVGGDIVFQAGEYAPHTIAGRELLAHELAHTVQQPDGPVPRHLEISQPSDSSEKETEAVTEAALRGEPTKVRSGPNMLVARQPAAAPAQTPPVQAAPMSRAAFDKVMTEKYRVQTIRTATFADQQVGDMDESRWHSWDPGSASPVYAWIVEGFQKFEATFGGLPPVTRILFAEAPYRSDDTGHMVADPGVLCSYGLGELNIYKGATTTFPQMQISGALKNPTPEESVHRNITHELGHGVAETAMDQAGKAPGADPQLFVEYRRAVGWTPSAPDELYDGGREDVQQALIAGTPPPADARITQGNWWKSTWKERPLTQYMTANPGDDFAEAMMAYINDPAALKALAPIRFKFLEARKSRWLASGQPKVNIWKQARQGGPARTLQPSVRPTVWERARNAK